MLQYLIPQALFEIIRIFVDASACRHFPWALPAAEQFLDFGLDLSSFGYVEVDGRPLLLGHMLTFRGLGFLEGLGFRGLGLGAHRPGGRTNS